MYGRITKAVLALILMLSVCSCDRLEQFEERERRIETEAQGPEKEIQLLKLNMTKNFFLTGYYIIIAVCIVLTICYVLFEADRMRHRKYIQKMSEEYSKELVNIEKTISDEQQKREAMTRDYKQSIDEMEHKLVAKDRSMTAMQSYIYDHLSIASKLLAINDETMNMPMTAAEWTELEVYLNTTSDDFVKRLRNVHPDIDKMVLRFCMLLRLKLTNRQMAVVYGIAEKSVKQRAYTYKNKLKGVPDGVSLRDYIEKL